MITTLKITLVRGRYCEFEWSANIELDESATLEDLHHAIQRAVKFDNDHLYTFFVARTHTSGNKEFFDDENGSVFNKTVKDMFPLPPKQSLYYLFDWGDEWIFKVTMSRKKPHEPVKRTKYPRVESVSGKRPTQYRY